MSGGSRRRGGEAPDLFASLDATAARVASRAAAPGATPETAASVTSVARTARELLEGAILPLWVRGEVTDFKAHRNGHWYFCLRDESSQLRCVVWSRDNARIAVPPTDGVQINARGHLTVYTARGDLQFTVSSLQPAGEGERRAAVERTLRLLREEGLLAPERKRPLPRFPRRIAVVTSPDGAAVRDIIAVARRRAPSVEIIVVAARVQGEGAPETLCDALASLARWGAADIVIIGRGGGGREDLHAFDDERVARALAASHAPTISAVGHEVDTSICDLVADLRAATPSAAAEAAVGVEAELRERIAVLGDLIRDGTLRRMRTARGVLADAARATRIAAVRVHERRAARVQAAAGRLHALSPLATLGRGYAVARGRDGGRVLATAAEVRAAGRFDLVLRDGLVRARTDDAPDATGGAA
jgi:exodeoxyribonuclease VII large subunit